jgi:L-2-hydroxycarboxylate dehydrogenase (NAD+)
MIETFYIVTLERHNQAIESVYLARGFSRKESQIAAKYSAMASWHGIRTHNALKAIHLDDLFGSRRGGCVPNVEIRKLPSRFAASQVWDAQRKLGQATAEEAIQEAIQLAERFGIGQVSVDNAFHYLWGGGYVMEAAKRGYIGYTNCTAALAEVVPFKGRFPTLGTNPHSWGFPTVKQLGFPIIIDWATSVIAMGRVQQYDREGGQLPPEAAVDKFGNFTRDPKEVAALTPFGAHKGYGLSLINELMGAYIGGSLPTFRSRWQNPSTEKKTPSFYFQVIHPEAIGSNQFSEGRSQDDNVKAVIEDILGHGNVDCILPGQVEAQWAQRCERNHGLLFTASEIEGFNEIFAGCHVETWPLDQFRKADAS